MPRADGWQKLPFESNFACVCRRRVVSGMMEKTNKSVLTDLQAFDVASLKGRLSELRRYL